MLDDLEVPGIIIATLIFVFILVFIPLLHCGCIGALCRWSRHSTELYMANEIPIDVDRQFAVRKALCNAEKSAGRVLSMHCTFWAYAWIIFFITGEAVWGEDLTLTVIGYIHLAVCVTFLWLETFLSCEYQYLSHELGEKSCKAFIQRLIEQQPVLKCTASAWHTEGDNECIIDHDEVEEFPISRWEDLSPSLDTLNLDASKITRVKLLKRIFIGDNGTQLEYNCMREEMLSYVRTFYSGSGSRIDFFTDFEVEGYTERMCGKWEKCGYKVWWINKPIYIIMSLFLMTWIYRIAFTAATQYTCFTVVKKIYASPAPRTGTIFKVRYEKNKRKSQVATHYIDCDISSVNTSLQVV